MSAQINPKAPLVLEGGGTVSGLRPIDEMFDAPAIYRPKNQEEALAIERLEGAIGKIQVDFKTDKEKFVEIGQLIISTVGISDAYLKFRLEFHLAEKKAQKVGFSEELNEVIGSLTSKQRREPSPLIAQWIPELKKEYVIPTAVASSLETFGTDSVDTLEERGVVFIPLSEKESRAVLDLDETLRRLDFEYKLHPTFKFSKSVSAVLNTKDLPDDYKNERLKELLGLVPKESPSFDYVLKDGAQQLIERKWFDPSTILQFIEKIQLDANASGCLNQFFIAYSTSENKERLFSQIEEKKGDFRLADYLVGLLKKYPGAFEFDFVLEKIEKIKSNFLKAEVIAECCTLLCREKRISEANRLLEKMPKLCDEKGRDFGYDEGDFLASRLLTESGLRFYEYVKGDMKALDKWVQTLEDLKKEIPILQAWDKKEKNVKEDSALYSTQPFYDKTLKISADLKKIEGHFGNADWKKEAVGCLKLILEDNKGKMPVKEKDKVVSFSLFHTQIFSDLIEALESGAIDVTASSTGRKPMPPAGRPSESILASAQARETVRIEGARPPMGPPPRNLAELAKARALFEEAFKKG